MTPSDGAPAVEQWDGAPCSHHRASAAARDRQHPGQRFPKLFPRSRRSVGTAATRSGGGGFTYCLIEAALRCQIEISGAPLARRQRPGRTYWLRRFAYVPVAET